MTKYTGLSVSNALILSTKTTGQFKYPVVFMMSSRIIALTALFNKSLTADASGHVRGHAHGRRSLSVPIEDACSFPGIDNGSALEQSRCFAVVACAAMGTLRRYNHPAFDRPV